MPDDLNLPRPRPAPEELTGGLRKAVEAVRAEPVNPEEINRSIHKVLRAGPSAAAGKNGSVSFSVVGTNEVNLRLRNGALPPHSDCAIPSQANVSGGQNMSSPANDVVQATCPGCQNSLRIPGNWIGQSMKCKHCGLVFVAKGPEKKKKKKRKRARDIIAGAARATKLVLSKMKRRRKKKRRSKDAPQAKPYMPPPAIPLGAAPNGVTPAAAIPLSALQPANALPVGAISASPMAVGLPMGGPGAATQLSTLPYEAPRRRSRGIQKLAFLMLFFLGMGAVAAVGVHMYQNGDVPQVGLGGAFDVNSTNKAPDLPPEPALKIDNRPPIPRDTAPATTPPPVVKDTGTPPPVIRPPLPKDTGTGAKTTDRPPVGPRPTGLTLTPPAVGGQFPRHMLAVIPANYAFVTPIAFGSNGPRSLTTVVQQFGEILRIPNDHVVLLSDKAPMPKPPAKEVIELNVKSYLEARKPQDRVVLLFIGHGVDIGDKPYLVPIEGEKDVAENLIPLEWVYQQLQKCPARQKIFVIDVCRYDPVRGEERGSVAPMGEKMDAMLKDPPAGIQVLTACIAGQNSFEVPPTGGQFEGGIMFSQVSDIKFNGGLKGVIQRPEDPIPIQQLVNTLGARTGAFARRFLQKEQTVRLTGTEAESKLVYDPKAPGAPRFDLKLPEKYAKGVASRNDLESLFKEILSIPPTKKSDQVALNLDSLPPFPVDKLTGYKDDGGNTPLREKVREAIDELKKSAQTNFQEVFLRTFDPANQQQANQFKNQIAQIQQNQIGIVQFKLDSVLDELDRMEADRAKENKRWQALYDYVRARLSAKLAYYSEYNYQLGQIRKEFPTIDPMIHKGWQLAAREKIADREAEKSAKKAKTLLDQVAKDNAGTPWEFIAKREKITAIGMEWTPSPK